MGMNRWKIGEQLAEKVVEECGYDPSCLKKYETFDVALSLADKETVSELKKDENLRKYAEMAYKSEYEKIQKTAQLFAPVYSLAEDIKKLGLGTVEVKYERDKYSEGVELNATLYNAKITEYNPDNFKVTAGQTEITLYTANSEYDPNDFLVHVDMNGKEYEIECGWLELKSVGNDMKMYLRADYCDADEDE